MLFTKTVSVVPPYKNLTLFVLEEIIRESENETISRRDLYMADSSVKGGMILIRRGNLMRYDRGADLLGRRLYGVTEDEIRNGAEAGRSETADPGTMPQDGGR